jgi:hypothetical protein
MDVYQTVANRPVCWKYINFTNIKMLVFQVLYINHALHKWSWRQAFPYRIFQHPIVAKKEKRVDETKEDQSEDKRGSREHRSAPLIRAINSVSTKNSSSSPEIGHVEVRNRLNNVYFCIIFLQYFPVSSTFVINTLLLFHGQMEWFLIETNYLLYTILVG